MARNREPSGASFHCLQDYTLLGYILDVLLQGPAQWSRFGPTVGRILEDPKLDITLPCAGVRALELA